MLLVLWEDRLRSKKYEYYLDLVKIPCPGGEMFPQVRAQDACHGDELS